MKPRFNHTTTTSVAVPPDGAAARGLGLLPPRAAPQTTPPARGLRSAWLRLQLFVAGARHSNRLKGR